MDFIIDHLAIGSAHEARAGPAGVTALLCVAEEVSLPHSPGVRHKVPIVDMQPIPPAQLREALQWIGTHIARERILVFCNAGVGRSTSVVIGYLCCQLNYGFGEAVEFVAHTRPYMSILPNLIVSIEEACGEKSLFTAETRRTQRTA